MSTEAEVFITGVQLVNPGEPQQLGSIGIAEGAIKSLLPADQAPPSGSIIFDGGGECIAMPGFIDIHTHGAEGVDLSDAKPGVVETIAEAKLREGVTTFLPTTWTATQEHLKKMAKEAACYYQNQRFARTPFLHVEGPYLNPAQAGAQDQKYMRLPSVAEIQELHDICPVGLVSLAVELDGANDFIAAVSKLDITTSAAHSDATYAEFKAARKSGLKHLTHYCNQMSRLHHRELGLVGAALLDDQIKIELICDTIHLCEEMIELVFKHRSCDQLMLITDSISAAHLGDGEYLQGDNTIIVKDGQARIPAGNLAGSTLQFHHGLSHVARITKLPMSELAKTTAYNQAQSLGLTDRGQLAVGKLGDLAILTPNFEVVATVVGGELRYQK